MRDTWDGSGFDVKDVPAGFIGFAHWGAKCIDIYERERSEKSAGFKVEPHVRVLIRWGVIGRYAVIKIPRVVLEPPIDHTATQEFSWISN